MRYFYRGSNPEEGLKHEQYFDDELDAKYFASDNLSTYTKYEVIDTENEEVVDSDIIAAEEEEANNDMMFPDEDSKEGFDAGEVFNDQED